jgi:hypothetical protein
MAACIAVKYIGNWAESFVTIGDGAPAAKGRAASALDAMIEQNRASRPMRQPSNG